MKLRFYSDTNFALARDTLETQHVPMEVQDSAREVWFTEEDYEAHYALINDLADKFSGDFYG